MRVTKRFAAILVVGIVVLAGCYALVPSVGSLLLERLLSGQGYRDVRVELGYPGLTSLNIPTLRLVHDLGDEQLSIVLEHITVEYTVSSLLTSQVIRVALSNGTVRFSSLGSTTPRATEEDESSSSILTLGDLSHAIPLLPFDELAIGQISVTREQATGPLRSMDITGSLRQGSRQVEAELTLRGKRGPIYHVTLSGQSVASHTLFVREEDPQAPPLLMWKSEASPHGSQVALRGQVQVHLHELAPFVAWMVPVGSDWDGATGSVLAGWSGTASAEAPIESIWSDTRTEIQGYVEIQASLPEVKGFGQAVRLGGVASVKGNAQRMTWSLAPGRLFSAVVNARGHLFPEAIRGAVPPGRQLFQIDALREVIGVLQSANIPTTLSFDGPIAASYGETAQRTGVTVTHLNMRGTEVEAVDGLLKLEGTMPKAIHDLLPVRTAVGTIVGTVAVDREGIRTVLTPPSHLRLRDWKQRDLMIPDVELIVMDTIPARWSFTASRWAVGASSLALKIPEAQWAEYAVTTERSKLQILSSDGSATTWQVRGRWQVDGVAPVDRTWSVPSTDWTLALDANPAQLTTDVRVETKNHRLSLTAKVTHDLASQRGALSATVGPVSFNRTQFRLSDLKKPWPYPFDVTDGQLSGSIEAVWGTDSRTPDQGIQLQSGNTALSISNLSGRYRDIPINGVTSTASLKILPGVTFMMPQPASISIASLNPGVEITNLAMTVQPEWQGDGALSAVSVRDVRWNMFGGEVASPGLKAVLAMPPYTLPLTLRQFDLQRVLNVEQQKGLQGTGVLDGTIPVTVSATGVSVKEGTLTARPPGGTIRYGASDEAAKAVTQSNAAMALVLQALNNFHYTVLQIGVDYAENGTLDLRTRLEGRNPEMKKSPPVHFNLTVQENIPALLKSLRLVQDIEESVQKKFVKP